MWKYCFLYNFPFILFLKIIINHSNAAIEVYTSSFIPNTQMTTSLVVLFSIIIVINNKFIKGICQLHLSRFFFHKITNKTTNDWFTHVNVAVVLTLFFTQTNCWESLTIPTCVPGVVYLPHHHRITLTIWALTTVMSLQITTSTRGDAAEPCSIICQDNLPNRKTRVNFNYQR